MTTPTNHNDSLEALVKIYSIDLAYAARKQKVGTFDASQKLFKQGVLTI